MRISDWSSDVCSSDLVAARDVGDDQHFGLACIVEGAGNREMLDAAVHMARAGADVGVGPAPNSVGAAAPTAAQGRRGDEHALRGAIDDFGDRPCGVEPVAVEAAVE